MKPSSRGGNVPYNIHKEKYIRFIKTTDALWNKVDLKWPTNEKFREKSKASWF